MNEFNINITLTIDAPDYDEAEAMVIDFISQEPMVKEWRIHGESLVGA